MFNANSQLWPFLRLFLPESLPILNQSQIAEFALAQFARVYDIEREVKELGTEQRQIVRQQQSRPILDALHDWMTLQRRQYLTDQQPPWRWTTAYGAGWR